MFRLSRGSKMFRSTRTTGKSNNLCQNQVVFCSNIAVAVGISLIFKGRCDLGGDAKLEQANRINNYTLAGVFVITIINVFITAFSSTPAIPKTIPAPKPQE